MKRRIYRRRKPLKRKVTRDQADKLTSLVLRNLDRMCLLETQVRRHSYELKALRIQLMFMENGMPAGTTILLDCRN